VAGLVRRWTQRINAASLRERAMMFASAAVALVAAADALVISPALAERKALGAQLREQTQQVDALRARQTASARAADDDTPESRQRRAIAAARLELAQLEPRIRSQLAARDEIARLPAVLDRLLARHDHLTLVHLSSTDPGTSRIPAAGDAPIAAASPAVGERSRGVQWRGVELGVAGRWADLVRYLDELEAEMPGLRWGLLRIATPKAGSSPGQDPRPVAHLRLSLPADAP
jgi:MSHA biogenesis protein MshJ